MINKERSRKKIELTLKQIKLVVITVLSHKTDN